MGQTEGYPGAFLAGPVAGRGMCMYLNVYVLLPPPSQEGLTPACLPVTCQSYFRNVESGSERGRERGGVCGGSAGIWEAGQFLAGGWVGGKLHALPMATGEGTARPGSHCLNNCPPHLPLTGQWPESIYAHVTMTKSFHAP